jgi:hypothetical protein
MTNEVPDPITQKEKPKGMETPDVETKELERVRSPVTPITPITPIVPGTKAKEKESAQDSIIPTTSVIGDLMREKYAEAAEKTRAEQARMIESFERKREKRLELECEKTVDLRLNS